MHSSGHTAESIMKQMLKQAYDTFSLDIQSVQILLARPSDNWKEALLDNKVTDMHILEPTALYVTADICVVDDDPRLPKTKVSSKYHRFNIFNYKKWK